MCVIGHDTKQIAAVGAAERKKFDLAKLKSDFLSYQNIAILVF